MAMFHQQQHGGPVVALVESSREESGFEFLPKKRLSPMGIGDLGL